MTSSVALAFTVKDISENVFWELSYFLERRVIPQKGADLINIAAQAYNESFQNYTCYSKAVHAFRNCSPFRNMSIRKLPSPCTTALLVGQIFSIYTVQKPALKTGFIHYYRYNLCTHPVLAAR
jgi:hypothetical protein